jgi:hypothetical protein
MGIARNSLSIGAWALFGLAAGALSAGAALTPSPCADHLTVMKAEVKKAAAGPKADEAKTHVKAAAAAYKRNDVVACVAELNAAEAALK